MYSFDFRPIHFGCTSVPDGYFFYCSAGRIIAAPYSKTYDPNTQTWHYKKIGTFVETGDSCDW